MKSNPPFRPRVDSWACSDSEGLGAHMLYMRTGDGNVAVDYDELVPARSIRPPEGRLRATLISASQVVDPELKT